MRDATSTNVAAAAHLAGYEPAERADRGHDDPPSSCPICAAVLERGLCENCGGDDPRWLS
jgi:hypothetical protein